jgi:glycosyltransferase involved in cell wall biosynthesis
VKVLLLHQHFNTPKTGGALRSYYLAKALVDRNIEVVVITGCNGNSYRRENVEGIDVHYLSVPYENKFGFWERSISFMRYNFGTIKLARKFDDVEICYAISVPLTIGLAAYWLKVRHGIRYIFEVGDLWPDAPIQMGFVNNYFLKRFLYWLEKFIYNQASSVVALSPAIKTAIEKRAPGKKVYLIPNMADTNFYFPEPKDDGVLKKIEVPRKFTVSYIGAVGLANGLDYYVECARACQKAGIPVHFILCGDGALLEYFKRVTIHHQLKNFSILPFQNREGVKEIMNVTDVAFICYKPLPVLETGSPNKYFDGLAAGKMIAINFDGWIREEIERENCGIFADARYPTDFVKKIEQFVNAEQKLKQCQQASRSLAETKYSRDILSQKFSEIFTAAL